MNTANRVLWAIIGLLLLALGVLGALASLDRLSGVDANSAVLPARLDQTWRDLGAWAPLLSIAVGLLLAILGGLLLRAQLRRRGRGNRRDVGLPDVVVPALPVAATDSDTVSGAVSDTDSGAVSAAAMLGRGSTRIASDTLSKALSRDLLRNPDVDSATAYLTGTTTAPKLFLRLTVSPVADLSRLPDVVNGAVERFAATTGLRPEVADVDVRVSDQRLSRVH